MNESSKLLKITEKHSLYKEFCEWYREQADSILKDTTLLNYINHLEQMRKNYGLNLDKPNVKTVVKRLNKGLTDDTLSPRTLSLRTFILRKWLIFRKIPIDDLKSLLKAKRGNRRRKIRPKDLLMLDEVSDIVSHTQSPALRSFWMVLWDLGCRPNELCQTNIEDVQQDKHGYVFTFWETKTEQSKRSVRLLTPQANRIFEQWWAIHPKRHDPKAPVFINTWKTRVRATSLIALLKKQHEKRLERGKHGERAALNLYLFRKSRATQLLKEKKFSEIEIKMRMGHKKDSQMLEQYYAILDDEDQSASELRYLEVDQVSEETAKMPICDHCGALNAPDSPNCQRCLRPLTSEAALVQRRMIVEDLLGDPATLQRLAEIVASRLSGEGKDDQESP